MINISKPALRHIIKHHTVNQFTKYTRRSKFNSNVDLVDLINAAAQQPFSIHRDGNLLRTFDAGYPVGVDKHSRIVTPIVTVITRPNGDLITMFPGRP